MELRPMNLGEILDRSFQVYRRQFWAFVAVAAVPALVVQGISMADAFWLHLYSSATRDNHWTPGIYMTRGVFAIGYYNFESFVSFLMFPVILKLVSCIVFDEEIKFRDNWRLFGVRWRVYLWLATLEFVAGLAIVEFLTVVFFALNMDAIEALGAQSLLEPIPGLLIAGFWFAAGFAAFLWVGSWMSLAIPSAALENLKAWRALRRSWALTRGSRLRIALTWVTLAIASWMLSTSIQWILRLVVISVVRSAHARWVAYTLYPILSQTLNTALAALIGPIYPIAITLFYYDQRIRREGYDIERMMETAGLIAPAPPPAGDSLTASVPEGRPKRDADVGTFFNYPRQRSAATEPVVERSGFERARL
jgi:hypothetical protein